MELSRRAFVKASALAAALAAAGCGTPAPVAPKQDPALEGATWHKTVCRYCGVGCGVMVGTRDGKVVGVKGDTENPVNKGLLCVKGYYLHRIMQTEEGRILRPLIRKDGKLVEASWDEALDLVASKFREAIDQYGPDSVGFYGSGQTLVEESYVANKLFKGCIGTNNIEGNPRTCMASAVAGFASTFGKDEPMGSLDDIEHADTFFIIGSNTAEAHPIVYNRVTTRKQTGQDVKVILADPRKHRVADIADIFLPFKPGTDLALLNALAQVIVAENLHDPDFIARHTKFMQGDEEISFEQYAAFLQDYTPEKVAGITGLDPEQIRAAARLIGARGRKTMSMWCMGINQRTVGTWLNNAIYNLHLLTGKICQPGNSPFSLTGQPSACGSVREVGALSHLLPCGRSVTNEEHRKQVAAVWGVDHTKMSPNAGLHTIALFKAAGEGKIKALMICCTNPGHSLPNLNSVRDSLQKTFLVCLDAFHNRTTELADVVLPSALWCEKEGMYGNTERRTQHLAKAVEPKGESKPDLWILLEIARRMGYGEYFAHYTSNEVIWEEYRKLAQGTGYDFAPYERYKQERGLRWPITDKTPNGCAIRYAEGYDPYVPAGEGIRFYGKPDGKAVIYARPHQDPAEMPDAEYPFYLSTGRILEHWHTITMTKRVPEIMKGAGEFYCELHEEDAAAMGIATGDLVRLTTRRGSIVTKARVKGRGVPQRGMAMLLMHDDDPERLTNFLTNDAVDATSKQMEYKICAVRIEKV
ncbi:nitrate reductase NapA [Symbiobacterium terraclitae]|uniref:Nitrate reductase n=1 Tax=Symbiobacterium terraclitae TaxID=557451 RepID=A0ABS4JT81_9FIRM|nr:nitrate reductase [Symbiobacterium terraclitae]MBP2018740.1 nitrate reductase NapA [Symbiobacterium terraclitae]